MTTATELFRSARDFLLEHREDYTAAYEGFRWPRPEHFNWALDWFDAIADGNGRTALHIVEEDGSEVRVSFAEMSAARTGSPTGCGSGASAPRTASSSCSATRPNCGRPRSPR